jgi:hypothetical protein
VALRDRLTDSHNIAQRALALDRETEQFGQLADQHGQGDAVHVAVTNRLRQQLGDKPEPQQAGQNAHGTRYDGHHARERNGPRRIAGR